MQLQQQPAINKHKQQREHRHQQYYRQQQLTVTSTTNQPQCAMCNSIVIASIQPVF